MRRIVAGIDGSRPAVEALRWAAREAEAHDATLVVVSAFTHTDFVGVPGAMWPVDTLEELEARAAEAMEAAIAEVGVDHAERQLVYGPAAQVLVDAARDADLLVVGARGRGALARLLLGSVSRAVVAHATCPVVVVPDAARTEDAARQEAETAATV